MKSLSLYFATTIILLLGGLVFMFFGGQELPGRLGTFVGGVLVTAALVATMTDLKDHKILNSTTFPALAIIVSTMLLEPAISSWNIAGNVGFLPVEQMILGAGACFVLTWLPFAFSGKGAGDVKLATLCGAALGVLSGVSVLVLAYLVAAGLLFSYQIYIHGALKTCRSVCRSVFSWILPLWVAPPNEHERAIVKTSIPLAPGFFLASIFMLYRS